VTGEVQDTVYVDISQTLQHTILLKTLIKPFMLCLVFGFQLLHHLLNINLLTETESRFSLPCKSPVKEKHRVFFEAF